MMILFIDKKEIYTSLLAMDKQILGFSFYFIQGTLQRRHKKKRIHFKKFAAKQEFWLQTNCSCEISFGT